MATTNFTKGRYLLTGNVFNGHIYILGGYNSTDGPLDDVRFAKINMDGSLGAWINTKSFSTGRWGFSSVENNGYLYIIGGLGLEPFNDVQYAEFLF